MKYSVFIRLRDLKDFEAGAPVEFTNDNYFVQNANYVKVTADPRELKFISKTNKRVAGKITWRVKKTAVTPND